MQDMNYSMLLISLWILTTFVSLSFNVDTTSASTSVVEKLICNKTLDPNFCTAILRSNHRSQNASAFDLAILAVDLASANATATTAKIHSLYRSEANASLKYYFAACEEYYEESLVFLGVARKHLQQGDYDGANEAASAAYDNADYCEDALNTPPFKSTLTKENANLQMLAQIIVDAANMMPISSRHVTNAALKKFHPFDGGFRVLGARVIAFLLIVIFIT
ncbi:hypothetical protein ABFS83_09G028900 [Erythranthe nasuta]